LGRQLQNAEGALQAQIVLGCGSGGAITAFFGGVWLYWGASFVGVFPALGFVAEAVVEAVLLGGSVYLMRRGRILRKRQSPLPGAAAMWRAFAIVVVLELILMNIGANIAVGMHRPDLVPIWVAIVAGLHSIPLARVFRTPAYTSLGIAMTLWTIFCLAFLRGNVAPAYTCFGSGVVLWVTSAYALYRGRYALKTARVLTPSL